MHTANVSLISNLAVFQTICLLRNGLDFQIYNKRVHVLRNLVVGTRASGDTIYPLQLNRISQPAPHAKRSPLPDHRSMAPLAHFPGGTSLGLTPNICVSP
ncbi:hypothetical protein J7T55_005118 [Diaporthe amygdali]|uniref:uncharacterized protein n=1 Tax=Phomopsis amygdali TaxID=1214568 RepID=UPI0022FEAAD5|nr:uncharacterized protein J7T55_005118 [Diaporthe amygdali]KAJ0116172.1 hypothetical protein J7T55_005118 [Diaporthe amygdali]